MNLTPQQEERLMRETVKHLRRLAKSPPIEVEVNPLQAWHVVAMLQYAWRNPNLTEDMRAHLEQLGRCFQHGIVERVPEADELLEMGWHPEHDVPAGE